MTVLEPFFREALSFRSLLTGEVVIYYPPPQHGTITHGREISAANTGLNYNGIPEATLTPAGALTVTTPGAVIEGKKFSGSVLIQADDVILRDCLFTGWGQNFINLKIEDTAHNVIVEGIEVRPAAGHSAYEGIINSGVDSIIRRNNIHDCENACTIDNSGMQLYENFFHTPSAVSSVDGHRDLVEFFSGSDWVVERNRLQHDESETTPFNVAPWGGFSNVMDNGTVQDNYIGGGIYHVLFDEQTGNPDSITNMRVLRNDMDGHTFPGYTRYWALHTDAYRETVETEEEQALNPQSILWPTSGPDVNYWVNCSDLTPDRTGQIIIP